MRRKGRPQAQEGTGVLGVSEAQSVVQKRDDMTVAQVDFATAFVA